MAKQNKRAKCSPHNVRVDDYVAGACFSAGGDDINQNVGAVSAELPSHSHGTYADGAEIRSFNSVFTPREGVRTLVDTDAYNKLRAGSAILSAANAELIKENNTLKFVIDQLHGELAHVRAELAKFTAPSSPAPEGNWLTRLKRIDQGRALYDRSRIIGGLHT